MLPADRTLGLITYKEPILLKLMAAKLAAEWKIKQLISHLLQTERFEDWQTTKLFIFENVLRKGDCVIYFWSNQLESETLYCACDYFFKTADLFGIDVKF